MAKRKIRREFFRTVQIPPQESPCLICRQRAIHTGGRRLNGYVFSPPETKNYLIFHFHFPRAVL